VAHGVVTKTYSVTHLPPLQSGRRNCGKPRRSKRRASGNFDQLCRTAEFERAHVARRFTRLTNAFSKKLENHAAAVSLYVTHYNMCRVHETLRTTRAVALGLADRVWSIGDLLDAALAVAPADPTTTAPDRRRRFRVIDGGLS